MSRHALTRALRAHVAREKADAERTMQLGEVLKFQLIDTEGSPAGIQIDLLEGRATLDEDEVTLTQAMRRYHNDHVIDPGDTVVLLRKRTGGEIHWIVTDVLADKDPW
jgi:hypothetical protein